MDVVNRPLPKDFIKTKTKSAPVLWIARNCRATNGREKYIKKLMEYVDVHSYGPCLNNKPFPSDKSRLNLMSEYKFYLAIENANCEDYVTEKLFDTLSQSAVPILDGPPSYEGFLPTQRSAIFMDAYPDPKDLADYINFLDKNDTAYLEYLSFRRDALDKSIKDRLDQKFIDNWSDTMAFNEKSSYCSVCRGVLPWWAYKNDPTKRQSNETFQEKKDVFVVDNTCAKRGKWDYIDNGPPYHPDWTPRSSDEFTRPNFYVNSTEQQPSHHAPTQVATTVV
ncbi:hypothetical protein BDF20DRAFT_907899 [Mycotypha africana]|uniref:uncharacterized protein n=1 Tax=Mycotypha africana TaxID=64632 RepID=UPI002301D4B0|nr:uncharacterized protein BDF20DRAFT_907899 [Mycotypha africana]KAI8969152.1 hypothetical protein BDF20DRAFT_907899 [Mycotypha africana]